MQLIFQRTVVEVILQHGRHIMMKITGMISSAGNSGVTGGMLKFRTRATVASCRQYIRYTASARTTSGIR